MKRHTLYISLISVLLSPILHAHLSPDDSLDQVELKLKEKPNDVSLLLDKAHVLIIMVQLEKAESTLKRVGELENSWSADTTYLHILLQHKYGDLEKAFEISDWGIKQFPDNHYQWEIRGRICQDSGRTEEAIQAMTQSLQLRKTVNSESYMRIVNILLDRNNEGDKAKAVALLREGISRIENPSDMLHLSIRLHTELKQYDKALDCVKKLEKQFGLRIPFCAKRGEILELAGRNAEAIESYRTAIGLVDAMLTISSRKKRNEQLKQLKKVFQTAIEELSAKQEGETGGE